MSEEAIRARLDWLAGVPAVDGASTANALRAVLDLPWDITLGDREFLDVQTIRTAIAEALGVTL